MWIKQSDALFYSNQFVYNLYLLVSCTSANLTQPLEIGEVTVVTLAMTWVLVTLVVGVLTVVQHYFRLDTMRRLWRSRHHWFVCTSPECPNI